MAGRPNHVFPRWAAEAKHKRLNVLEIAGKRRHIPRLVFFSMAFTLASLFAFGIIARSVRLFCSDPVLHPPAEAQIGGCLVYRRAL